MTENGHDMIKSYSDLAGISICYNYFGGADLLTGKNATRQCRIIIEWKNNWIID